MASVSPVARECCKFFTAFQQMPPPTPPNWILEIAAWGDAIAVVT